MVLSNIGQMNKVTMTVDGGSEFLTSFVGFHTESCYILFAFYLIVIVVISSPTDTDSEIAYSIE